MEVDPVLRLSEIDDSTMQRFHTLGFQTARPRAGRDPATRSLNVMLVPKGGPRDSAGAVETARAGLVKLGDLARGGRVDFGLFMGAEDYFPTFHLPSDFLALLAQQQVSASATLYPPAEPTDARDDAARNRVERRSH